VIGGAGIVDLAVLVVDAAKGVQTQTAECLVLGEIVCPQALLVAINKIDMIDEAKRQAHIEKVS